ncbi:MAG TPA: acyl-CoA dehydrogenase family protein [Terriglobia bacterium]|nr:acyl-CoA dehydrogenase family protein [Terriglobia bacterium]
MPGQAAQSIGVPNRIQSLLPEIRRQRAEIEKARQLPRDVAAAMRATGMFRLAVPRAIGGEEAEPVEILNTIEAIAAADGSAGWCAMIGIASNVSSGYMNETGAREVFADPAAPTAGIAAPAGAAVRADGGMIVNGRWSFASGITHCDWVWAGCVVMENGKLRMTATGPEVVHVCMPVREVVIHDTWHVSGLCGTGSNDFSATNVFVPQHRLFALLDPADHRKEPLCQMPPLIFFTFELAAVGLGIARAALDELRDIAPSKTPTLYSQVLAEKAVVHVDVARAEAGLRAARCLLYETVESMWRNVSGGSVPTKQELAVGHIAATHAVETAASVTRIANTLAGGSSIYLTAPLQRHARDAEALTHHFTVAPHTWEEAGRVFMGREPIVAVY